MSLRTSGIAGNGCVCALDTLRCGRGAGSLARYRSVLCGYDLPFAIALQPGVGPDKAAHVFLPIFCLPHGPFTAIDHCEVVAEVADLGIVKLTPMIQCCGVGCDGFSLAETFAAGSGTLEVVGNNVLQIGLLGTVGLRPLTLAFDDVFYGRIGVGGPP